MVNEGSIGKKIRKHYQKRKNLENNTTPPTTLPPTPPTKPPTNTNNNTTTMVLKGKDALLVWCSSLVSRYNLTINNFTSSWWDGLVFCGILHRFFPSSIPMSDLVEENWRMNLSIAFRVAEEVGFFFVILLFVLFLLLSSCFLWYFASFFSFFDSYV